MTWFQSFRGEHGFMFYGDQTSPASLDKPLVAVVYLCVLVSGATLLATLGIRGREKWSHAIRASYGVAIASIILICIVSHDWMEGHVEIKAPFVYRSNMHFYGDLSLRIGLRSANITLDGTYMSPSGGKQVYYVETLPWPDYGTERLSYCSQLQRGLPGPILRVMDFLTYDNGDLQWGKSFHRSGQFAWALLWTSFVFWLLSNLLLFSVVMYGAYMFFLAGVTLLMACVAFSQGLNSQPLQMTFGQQVLKLEYGWSFWLAIVAGSMTTLLGTVLILTDIFLHQKVAEFFHLEDGDEDDSYKDEFTQLVNKKGMFNEGVNGAPQNDRRGSIFLEPERQTNWVLNPVGGKGNPLRTGLSQHLNKGLDEDAKQRNANNGNPKLNTRSKSENSIFLQGRPYQPSRISNDRKPSLATLKEHRENHANERISNSSKSNLDQISLTRSLHNVRPPQHKRFLYDTAESIRLRSAAPMQNGGCSQESNRSDSTETVVEAVVENHCLQDDELDECCVSFQQGEESLAVLDDTPQGKDVSTYQTHNSLESETSCFSLGDNSVFDSCAPSRRVSGERAQGVGATVIEVSGTDDREHVNRVVEPLPETKHVSIQIDPLPSQQQ